MIRQAGEIHWSNALVSRLGYGDQAADDAMPYYPTRKLTVLALDPSVTDAKGILRAQIEIPNETLDVGPRGHRVHVIDYDATEDVLYKTPPLPRGINSGDAQPLDPFEKATDDELLSSPCFHAFMAYGVVMRTLAQFEYALGRHLSWSFSSQQISVAPHAFADANAFYSDTAQGLFFGYFASADGQRNIFSCLSYEVIAHETTHALLDGLRERYTDPSSPQQAGFHEGFADIVALLSIFSNPSLVSRVVDLGLPNISSEWIKRGNLTPQKLRMSGLFGLAQEMGSELAAVHGQALRRSVTIEPNEHYLDPGGQYDEPHACGEILVAAVLNAYLEIWIARLQAVGSKAKLDRARAAEEGADLASRMLTMFVRAIDYCPPTDLQFARLSQRGADVGLGTQSPRRKVSPAPQAHRVVRQIRHQADLERHLRARHLGPAARGVRLPLWPHPL